MSNESEIRREIALLDEYLAQTTARMQSIEAERDRLILLLADNEGLHDRHPVAVR